MKETKTEMAEKFIKLCCMDHLKAAETRLYAKSADDFETAILGLTESVKQSSESSKNLGVKVLWLNIILTLATVALAVIAGIELYTKIVN